MGTISVASLEASGGGVDYILVKEKSDRRHSTYCRTHSISSS